MADQWKYQVRIELADRFVDVARQDPDDPALAPLTAVLRKHRATMKCQFDAFAEYVAEAERRGPDNHALYAWTRATIDDPAKKKKHMKSFALYVEGEEVYAAEKAEALEADVRRLVGGNLVERMFKFDSNPANNPQPPAGHRRDGPAGDGVPPRQPP